MGQYNDRVRRAAAHIPHGSVAQSRFKLEVVHLYSRGYPIAEAVVEVANGNVETIRDSNRAFTPSS